jgi:lipid-binding SYLF domain-containing protein
MPGKAEMGEKAQCTGLYMSILSPCPTQYGADRGFFNSLLATDIAINGLSQEIPMGNRIRTAVLLMVTTLLCQSAWADEFQDTIDVFKGAGESGTFFNTAYGYAVFPTIGKAGIGLGGAYGKGRVYAQGQYTGDAKMTQVTIGFQLGGQAYSQIIFLEDKRAFDEFTSGNFEFGAQATAVAITAGANASATTSGNSAGASGGQHDATTVGQYHKGMAVFTVTKGGLMYEASIGGQKFEYTPK